MSYVKTTGIFLLLALLLSFVGCSTGNCRQSREKETGPSSALTAEQEALMNSTYSVKDRVQVYKPDGSLQCGEGRAIAPEVMKKELAGIQVFAAENKDDGLFHPQACGLPTGKCNVFTIDRKDLEKAKKLGFKEWTY